MDARSHQLPSHLVVPEFGEVNVRREPGGTVVQFLMNPTMDGAKGEGWQTGVALDASASMRHSYGRGRVGTVPPEALAGYQRNGWVHEERIDGRKTMKLKSAAHEDAVRRGFIRPSDNVIQPLAREFIALLAERLDEDGGTTVIYWACDAGDGLEILGDFTGPQCRSLQLAGPKQFGRATVLLPAVRYFVDRFRDANKGIYVFLADGNFDDLGAVKKYTTSLARDIEEGRRNFVKCVLIGIGEQIDEGQMEELDDLDTGTGVDIWDHKIAREMRSLNDIFAELADEHTIVASSARIYDDTGRLVKKFTTGMPAKVEFSLPAAAGWFELELEHRRIRQPLAPR